MSTILDPGQRIPTFELPDQHGTIVRSADLLGEGACVIFFYPRDDSPGCTVEACSFRDANDDFAAAGARLVGISSDGVESHRKFADNHALKYTLLSDAGGRVRAQFGVKKQLLGLVAVSYTHLTLPTKRIV